MQVDTTDSPASIQERVRADLQVRFFEAETTAAKFADIARYFMDCDGHMWRPAIASQAFCMLAPSVDPLPVMRLGVAVELLHAGSLLLDDLPMMDDASRRRGRRCAHLVFGEAAVVSTVLWLSDLSSRVLSEAVSGAQDAREVEARFHLTKSRMLEGQRQDLEENGERSLEAIVQCYRLKSGALFEFTLGTVAVLAGRAEHRVALERFGSDLGVAYQITDDIHDSLGSPQDANKDLRKDIGKSTIPNLLGIEGAKKLISSFKRTAEQHLRSTGLDCDSTLELASAICRW